MHLRKLKKSDASYMLEWMHDNSIIQNLQADFANMTIKDCEKFIENSINKENINLAIVDDKGIYMGTVSLKHISDISAEFAIVVRKSAMGQGYSIFAMKEILKYAFCDLGLKKVYWCVSSKNIRALRFYDKYGFSKMNEEELVFPEYSLEKIKSYIWYQVQKMENL